MDETNDIPALQAYIFLLCIMVLGFLLSVPMVRYEVSNQVSRIINRPMYYSPITYLKEDMLSPVSKFRLTLVRRKTLVLDMDETLITSVILYNRRAKPNNLAQAANIPYDYSFQLPMSQLQVYVYKRPYVDFFLDRVSQWYDLVIFTAAKEEYASLVLNYLDAGRNILNHRLYRHNCINICGVRAKFVSIAHSDLANVLLLDNSHIENSFNMGNTVHIKSFSIGSIDEELLCMLPFLDALRFTHDVRSVLGRNIKYDCLLNCLTMDVTAIHRASVNGANV